MDFGNVLANGRFLLPEHVLGAFDMLSFELTLYLTHEILESVDNQSLSVKQKHLNTVDIKDLQR